MKAIVPKMAMARIRLIFGVPLAVAAILVLVLLPITGLAKMWILYLFLFFIYLTISNMWNLLAGYCGLISLCPPAFIGLAGYAVAILTWISWPWYIGIIIGGIVAALFAVIISYPAFRMKGIYFAIATLILPQILRYVFFLWKPVGGVLYGGGAGYTVKGADQASQSIVYWLALIIGIISIFVIRIILRSKLGHGLAAIHDNDVTAASIGINVFNAKFLSFVISAFITGIAGGIFYVYSAFIEPTSAFGLQWVIAAILIVVIGGIGTEFGPVIGAIIYVLLSILLAQYAQISLLIQGIILVGIMLIAPQGIMGVIMNSRAYRYLLRSTAKT